MEAPSPSDPPRGADPEARAREFLQQGAPTATSWLRRFDATRVVRLLVALGGMAVAYAVLDMSSPGMPDATAHIVSATLLVAIAVVVMLSTQPLLHAPEWIVATFVAVPMVAAWFLGTSHAADVAKLLAALALGMLVAQQMERAWWVVPLGIAAGLYDLWRSFSPSPILDRDHEIFRMLRIDGPTFADASPLGLALTEVAAIGVVLGVVLLARLPLATNTIALVAALAGAQALEAVAPRPVPAMLVLLATFVAVNSRLLWQSIRTDLGADPLPGSAERSR